MIAAPYSKRGTDRHADRIQGASNVITFFTTLGLTFNHVASTVFALAAALRHITLTRLASVASSDVRDLQHLLHSQHYVDPMVCLSRA